MSVGKGIVACVCGVGVTIAVSRHMDISSTAFLVEGVPIPWLLVIIAGTIIAALALMSKR